MKSSLWSCRLDRITNHHHPFDALGLLRAGLSPFTFHLSPIPNLSLLTSHFSLLTAALAAQQYRPPFGLRHLDQITGMLPRCLVNLLPNRLTLKGFPDSIFS